jgi:hypothetical protein
VVKDAWGRGHLQIGDGWMGSGRDLFHLLNENSAGQMNKEAGKYQTLQSVLEFVIPTKYA